MSIKCDSCGDEVRVHAILDSEDWEAIADGAYALCPFCIDARLASRGMMAECDLHFVGAALRSVRTDRVERSGAWRDKEICRQERAGLNSLFRVRAG